MAEEEILTEQAPAPQKKQGGGFSFVHLIFIAIVTAIVVAIGFVLVSGTFKSTTSELEQQLEKATRNQYGKGVMQDFTTLKDCEAEGGMIMPLSEDPLIVNLADGQHYLSVGISVCVSEDVNEQQFQQKKPVLLHVANEFLSQYNYSDIFPTAAGEEPAPEPAATTEEMDLENFGFEEEPNQSFSLKKDQMRGGLLKAMAERNIRFVEELYFTEFLVQ